MKAAALEQDSDDEDEDWAPGGFHPAALPRQVVLLNCPIKFWCALSLTIPCFDLGNCLLVEFHFSG